MFKPVNPKVDFPKLERDILERWYKSGIINKYLNKNNSSKKKFSFLDGPITANNPMGVHHAWGRTYKDFWQRFWNMQGYKQRFQNGFDEQGLWVEVEVEKELGLRNKKEIENLVPENKFKSLEKFINLCKERVKKFSAIQTEQSKRLGYFMDWDNSYHTSSDENNYAIWNFLKVVNEKGWLYKGRDSVPWCPRCGTAISQHEILTEEYKEITHDSIYFELPIVGKKDEYLLVWTTTPWTLIANIAVAVDEKIDYSLVKGNTGYNFWVAKDLVEKIFKGSGKIVKTVKGKELVGLKYTWAFDNLPKVKEVAEKNPDTFHIIIATDDRIMPINIEDGTGLVHTAVSAGQEDFQLGKKLGLPMVDIIGEDAVYLEGLGEFSGQNAKKDPKIILDYLVNEDKKGGQWVFEILPYKHRYPTCWRCKTELVWRVVDEWYISMDKLRKPLQDIVEKINWIPAFGKERELDWLKNMHDWLISKKRYWGLALPIFECKECGHFEVIGSKEELEKRAVEGWESFEGNSPHRPFVDAVKIKCKECKAVVSRVKDVGNPWLDAGIVPFSTINYFSDKKYWKKWFPVQVVTESFPGQFKNWFYSLLVMSAVLEETEPVKTIFGYASARDEKGEEMHKSKGNAIWFKEAVEKIGADPMRWLYARQNPADNLNFGYKATDDMKKKLMTLYNVYTFLKTYVTKDEYPGEVEIKPKNVLDKWIVSKIKHVIGAAEFNIEKYDVARAVLAIEDFFINDLSLWYLRRSRKRFNESSKDRKEAIETLYYVLLNTAKCIAPVLPFFAEAMYQELKTGGMPESVHLCDWPNKEGDHTDLDLEQKMDEARNIVTLALAKRSEKAIKVRQPLAKLTVKSLKLKDVQAELLDLIKDEVNVKEIAFDGKMEEEVELDLNITKELKEEGLIRDIIRDAQDGRKELGLKPTDKATMEIKASKELKEVIEKNKAFLLKEIRLNNIVITDTINSSGKEYAIIIKKI